MTAFQASLGDHATNPRNAGVLENATAIGHGSLDDERPFATVYLVTDRDTVSSASFQTRGCGYAIAVSSALTEWVLGKTIVECRALDSKTICNWFGGLPPHKEYCAELVCDALQNAIDELDV